MYLKKIRLRNWKIYGGEHEFELPDPGKRQNVVLIGGKNGYGKTSLLEAIALGLYGRDGLDIVARADSLGDDNKRRQSYRNFIESARYERAAFEGDNEVGVDLFFEDADSGSSFAVHRSWSFSHEGRLLGDGEVVTLEVDGARLQPGKFEDRDDFHRNQIARHTLPAHLAQFFLFDGERVQALAKRDMATQVKLGIEGFLGVKQMRDLGSDLTTYARNKRSEVKDVDSELLKRLNADLQEAEAQIEDRRKRFEDAEQRQEASQRESEVLQMRLSRMGGGSAQTVQRLSEQKAAVERTCENLTKELAELVGGDFALALAGFRIRMKVQERLASEQKLAASRAALESSRGRIGHFIKSLTSVDPQFVPALTADQQSALEAKIAAAWQSIWHPPEEGCAAEFRHAALSEVDRMKVLERLTGVAQLGEEGIAELLHKLNDAREQVQRLETQINTHSGIESSLEEVSAKLADVSRALGQAEKEKADLHRELQGLTTERDNKFKELQREQGRYKEALPLIRRAEFADKIRGIIDPFIDDAVGDCVDQIAKLMTDSFKEMAHKSHVDRITIDRDCEVKLLTRDGEDLRALDQSAGENQIFAFALISAISQAADIRFPLIVDTPLARLDAQHRHNVLRHFTQTAGEQIVFLSQDTEVVREFKDAISTRIRKTFRIENESRPGSKSGKARVIPHDYF